MAGGPAPTIRVTVPGGVAAHTWLTDQDCDLDEFRALVERTTDLAGYPEREPSRATSSSTTPNTCARARGPMRTG